MKRHWLIKSEPETYGIDHLARDKKTAWEGVRNFLARNYMRDQMHIGDTVLFYHSSCKVPGIYGLAKVASAPYPDASQYDKKGHYFEPRATKEKPVWQLVDIAFVRKFPEPVTLPMLRAQKKLGRMALLQPGSRLSITPVTEAEFGVIESLIS